jgi:hypothetical protein
LRFLTNPIVAENQLAGTDSSVWDIADSGDGTFKYGDPSFQGYAVPFSVNLGQQVTFKIKLTWTPIRYHIDIPAYALSSARFLAIVGLVMQRRRPT